MAPVKTRRDTNRFGQLIGAEFFKQIPQAPGVYKFYDKSENLLYVGKSVNLRARVRSYAYLKKKRGTTKILRMLRLANRVDWQICHNETDALLRENQLLRTHRPPFNVVNTRPDLYYFLGYERIAHQARFFIALTVEEKTGHRTFGAFRGRARSREAFVALLRILWAASGAVNGPRFEYPTALTRKRAPVSFHFNLEKIPVAGGSGDIFQQIDAFFFGESSVLLETLVLALLSRDDLPAMERRQLQEDLDLLREFFRLGPERSYIIKCRAGLPPRALIAQNDLDDLLARFGRAVNHQR
jgi:hypothetical protein